MHLERVDIENYRGVPRLAVGLDSVTTIIGEHHCGKSSLLAAISAVLDPAGDGAFPVFTESDFHRSEANGVKRASDLSITLRFRATDDDRRARRGAAAAEPPRAGDEPLPERFAIRVEAHRRSGAEPETQVTALGISGGALPDVDPADALRAVRHRVPALIIRWRWVHERPAPADDDDPLAEARRHISDAYRQITQPGMVVTHEYESLMRHVRRVARNLSEQLDPARGRPRSIEDLADTPQPLLTDVHAALEPDAGPHRHVALLLLVGAVLQAMPPGGLRPEAAPILLFDDIESNLHPIWLAAVTSVATNLPLQQVLTTHSSEVLNWMPLRSLRRLVRTNDGVQARLIDREVLSPDDLRRVSYHLRLNRSGSLFARCWVLVEGETEAWLVPEFARLCGVEFPGEGIRCIEFAQCGVTPLLKVARALRIGWVLLADGDGAGRGYVQAARDQLRGREERTRLQMLEEKDIEHYLYLNGYAEVIAEAAGFTPGATGGVHKRHPGSVIRDATKRASKPGLALAILEAANRRGAKGVPPAMRKLAESARTVARRAAMPDEE